MQSVISDERIFQEIKKAIAETLAVEEGSIRPESLMVQDLGAESLDFLDISYRLEQAFGFKMARYFILDHAEELFDEGSVIDDRGRITDKGIRILKKRFGSEAGHLSPGMDMEEISGIISVQAMVKAVKDILDTLPEHCPSCSAKAWITKDGTHIECESCRATASYTNGDDLVVEWLKRWE